MTFKQYKSNLFFYFIGNLDFTKRNFGLDLVRSIAICFVLLSHSLIFLLPGNKYNFIEFEDFFAIIGVELFFILSGFLIGTIIIKLFNENFTFSDIINFLLKRWSRTIPVYYIYLIIYIILYYFLSWNEFGIIKNNIIFSYFFFLQNLCTNIPAFYGISWSLSIEEWFYILFPFYIYTIIKIFPYFKKHIIYIIFSFVIFSFLLKVLSLEFGIQNLMNLGLMKKFSFETIRKMVLLRLDAIGFGTIMSYFFINYKLGLKKQKTLFFFLGFLSMIVSFFLIKYYSININFITKYLIFSLISISISFILPYFIFLTPPKKVYLNLITLISITSYSLYLSHTFVWIFFMKIQINSFLNPFISFISFWLISFVLSFFSFKYIERPILRLRNKYIIKNIE